jgi:toxin ParE1/3/4
MRYRLTPRAEADLVDIVEYTSRIWGDAQAETYLRRVFARLEWLAEHPALGRARPEIKDGYRSFLEGRHVIFYRVAEDGIDILGIPHSARDLDAFFEE